MPFLSLLRSSAALLLLATAASLNGQTFAANTGPDAEIGTPAVHASRVAVPGHRRHAEDKLLYGRIRDGVYTVDGMVAKVQLNYDVNGVGYLYLFVPGVGTALVSTTADEAAVAAPVNYQGTAISFVVGDHRFDLTGVTLATDTGAAPAHLYVRLDRTAWQLNRQPMIGFGDAAARPYVWPGALHPDTVNQAEAPQIAIPPVPISLLPSTTAVVPARREPVTLQPASFR